MVLPNRNTVGLLALLGAMWYAGASQQNAAAYLLGFVLAAVALVSLVHAWANLRGVTLRAETIRPVFAGEELCVRLTAKTSARRGCVGLRVKAKGSSVAGFGDVTVDAPQRSELCIVAPRRGRFRSLALQLTSFYPLGFFTARQRVTLEQSYFVYPRPEGALPLPRSIVPTRHRRAGLRVEGDDFAGTRSYQTGESQRHIDWKAAARGQPLLIKQWAGEADEKLRLEWEALAPMEAEARLSQLARWVLMAERSGATYSLQVPGRMIEASRGEAHFHKCLPALALYRMEDTR